MSNQLKLILILAISAKLHLTEASISAIRYFSALDSAKDLKYSVKYFTQRVDHFNYVNPKLTFRQRYIISEEHWCDGCPIFLYLGNEGDIMAFVNNTGFMWENAQEFRAMVLFIEHRYYGESFPFGKLDKSPDKIGYLTTGQALADFAEFIKFMKKTKKWAEDSPIILFGGSFAGMLAFWFRMKYPFLSTGALASSAPIFQFPQTYDCKGYFEQVTKDFAGYSSECAESIRRSWPAIRQMIQTPDGRQWLTKTFRLCDLLEEKDGNVFVNWIKNYYGILAMIDYPNEAALFVAKALPPYPIGEVCRLLRNPRAPPKSLLAQIYSGVSFFYNITGDKKCFNINDDEDDKNMLAWEYQTCTEMVMPMCTNGITDMMESDPWDFQTFSDECFDKYGVRPDYDKAITMFGGFDIKSVTNVIFTNGMRDPWTAGGLLSTVSPSLIAINISDACHHEDLRPAGDNDPPALRAVRREIVSILKVWIRRHYRKIGYFPLFWRH